jgi:hypothetical protein
MEYWLRHSPENLILRAKTIFKLFLLLSRVKSIVIRVPENRLDEGEHASTDVWMPRNFTVLKPDKILARLPLVRLTFKVVAWTRVDKVLDIS